MTRNKLSGFAVAVVGCVLTLASGSGVYAADQSTVLVVPARQRLVKLGFELVQVKDVCLVSYSVPAGATTPLIHVWEGRQWSPIDVDAYASGSFLSGEGKTLVVIGDSATVPAGLAIEPAWAGKVHKTASMDIASLVNELGNLLRFTPREWESIAALENLKLTDRNVERRRYGRWGAPGKEKTMVMPPPSASTDMPPVVPDKAPVVDLKATPDDTAPLKLEDKAEGEKPVPPSPPIVAPPAPPAPAVAPAPAAAPAPAPAAAAPTPAPAPAPAAPPAPAVAPAPAAAPAAPAAAPAPTPAPAAPKPQDK